MVPILKLLEQHSDLSMNYKELIKKERELQSRLESVEDVEEENELEQAIIKIEAEKKNVQTKFYDTVKQLKIRQITHFDEHLEPIA
ncbi:hypothetical protein CAEBREN_24365 [Caenorhabditis brenneri]|uniref:Uncharacterized protein n=1 Tax=Caenorhabditis brenneri TaxID=135651 RepID=G0NZ21_CAEBE|nr:hypothetical protein CAEBREN_24365 [Caenorhabditis brenneri]